MFIALTISAFVPKYSVRFVKPFRKTNATSLLSLLTLEYCKSSWCCFWMKAFCSFVKPSILICGTQSIALCNSSNILYRVFFIISFLSAPVNPMPPGLYPLTDKHTLSLFFGKSTPARCSFTWTDDNEWISKVNSALISAVELTLEIHSLKTHTSQISFLKYILKSRLTCGIIHLTMIRRKSA